MDSDDIPEVVRDIGAENNLFNLQTKQYREPARHADVVQIYKRINDEKFGAEVALTDEMQHLHTDMLMQQIEQVVRQMKETILTDLGRIFEYRDRNIACGVNGEIAQAQCLNCYYEVTLGELPYAIHDRQGTVQTFNTLERWKQQRLAMYLCERIDQECPCAKNRRMNNRKI